MANEIEEGPFYLEEVSIADDSDDDFLYEEVPVDDDSSFYSLENLDQTVYAIEEAKQNEKTSTKLETNHEVSVLQQPEVIEDFVRNFLMKMGLNRTLECFQTEWYELQQKGVLLEDEMGQVIFKFFSRVLCSSRFYVRHKSK